MNVGRLERAPDRDTAKNKRVIQQLKRARPISQRLQSKVTYGIVTAEIPTGGGPHGNPATSHFANYAVLDHNKSRASFMLRVQKLWR